jgi:cellulose synthase/poly-beta-1,6-N-acetylglucosamine synthase-like glycosyltransferase
VFDGFTFFGGGQAFFRSAVFEELGAFDEEILVEDIDMSSRIHEAGREIIIDPQIITFEENPTTLEAWWNQRKRWARGWMQVAIRYIMTLPHRSTIAFRKRVDAMYTFVYAIVPVMVVLAIPMAVFRMDPTMHVTTFFPVPDWILWNSFAMAPAVVAYLVFFADWREGHTHHPYEYLAAFTLWLYLLFQTVVFITAFIEEFLMRKPSVYVTTSRSEAEDEEAIEPSAD